eukprot:jgi/Pico_ML_1/54678/g553.t1
MHPSQLFEKRGLFLLAPVHLLLEVVLPAPIVPQQLAGLEQQVQKIPEGPVQLASGDCSTVKSLMSEPRKLTTS